MDFNHPHFPSYQHDGSDDRKAQTSITVHTSLRTGVTKSRNESNSSKFQIFPEAPSPRQTKTTWYSGWRTGALTAAALCLISLVINIVVGTWLARYPNKPNGLVEVYKGSCTTVKRLSMWTHLAINIFGTLLLGGSNYCMQCLSAPTRTDIDRSHAKARSLDIGILSFKNLTEIHIGKRVVWLALLLTSIPLHLLYNSVFYSALAANAYYILNVTPEFVTGGSMNVTAAQLQSKTLKYGFINSARPFKIMLGEDDISPIQAVIISGNMRNQYERLSLQDCIAAYAKVFLSDRRNLVIVTNDTRVQVDNTLLDIEGYASQEGFTEDFYSPFDWICQGNQKIYQAFESQNENTPCDSYVSGIEAAADQWQPWGYHAQYCLSERVQESCSLNGNTTIIFIVIACNAIKLMAMVWVAVGLRGSPLITVGDALESFLEHPDLTSKGHCLLTWQDVRSAERWGPSDPGLEWPSRTGLKEADLTQSRRWHHAASRGRWATTLSLLGAALIAVAALLAYAIRTIETVSQTRWWSVGFGAITGSAMVGYWAVRNIDSVATQVLASALVANTPQVILSFVYVNLNSLLTCMWLAFEWSEFAIERKTLRVSNPKGHQRSTHFLQLPYNAVVPLMVTFGLLHWLVSQAIFLAVVCSYDTSGNLATTPPRVTCGFSPVAMIAVLAMGVFVLVVTVLLGRKRFHCRGMPLVGSCSAAISAACHQPEWDREAHLRSVMWGAISHGDDEGRAEAVGHCCITSTAVMSVERGRLYA